MNLHEYQRSMLFIDHGPNLSGSIYLNFFSSISTKPIEAKFHVEPPLDGRTKACFIWSRSHDQDDRHAHIWYKSLKICFSGSKKPMTLKLGMQHWVLKYYQVCSNDAPGLTLTYFTARSGLVPYAFIREKVKTMDFSETTCIVVYDMKVGRCSHLNEYMKLYEYQRSRSFIDLVPNHSYLIFLNFFSSITADFNISSALRWAIQDQWSSGYLSYVGTGKPIVHAPMTSLKVSIINFISWTESLLLTEGILRYFCHKSTF